MSAPLLQVGCFGKLPFWREYLEGGSRSAAARELKEWLRQGREMHVLESSSGDQQVTDQAFPAHLRVLLSLPGTDELLVGVVRPSRDGGGRHAPFSVFARLPRRLYGKHYALLPSALGPVWTALEDTWVRLHEVPSRELFEQACESLDAPAPMEMKLARGEYQGRQLESAGKLFDRPALETLRLAMPDLLGRIKKGSRDVCVALPAAEDVDEANFNASMWIDLVNRQFRLRRFDPSVFLDSREGMKDRQIFLKFGRLNPADYVQMLGGLSGIDGSELLRPIQPAAEGTAEPLEATYKQLLETTF
jgi:type VI secretion system ImpM family protein